MEGDLIYINKKLRPLSWLYGLGVGFRNMLFDMGILKSRAYKVPVISWAISPSAVLARHLTWNT